MSTYSDVLAWLQSASHPLATVETPQGGLLTISPDTYAGTDYYPDKGRRLHRFTAVDSFADWLNRHADPKKAEVLIGSDEISAGLDPSTPNADVVRCSLELHPRAERWRKVLGRPLSQKAFYRLIVTADDDLGEAIDPAGKVVGRTSEFIAGEVSKLRVSKGAEYTAELDSRGNYKMRGGTDKTEVSGRLPSKLELTIPWFLGVSRFKTVPHVAEYELTLHVDIDTDTDPKNPTFSLSAPGLDLLVHEAHGDACAWLNHLLADGFLVGRGSFRAETTRLYTP